MYAEWVDGGITKQLARALRTKDILEIQRETLRRMDNQWVLRDLTLATRLHKVSSAVKLGRHLGKAFEETTRDDLEKYLARVANTCSPVTFATTKAFLRAFYKDLLAPDPDQPHPAVVRWIRVPNLLKLRKVTNEEILTPDQVLEIARACTHPRDRAIVMVTFESGGRRSELTSLTIGDLARDAYGGRLILGGPDQPRAIRLDKSLPDLLHWLSLHPKSDDPRAPMFLSLTGGGLTPAAFYSVIKTAAKRAGIKKRVYTHLFRHSRITNLGQLNVSDAKRKKFAGWAKNSPMLDVYDHLMQDDLDETMLQLAGKVPKENSPVDALTTRKCVRCNHENSPSSISCATCSLPLDEKDRVRALEMADMFTRNRATFEKLMRALDDQEVSSLLEKKAKER